MTKHPYGKRGVVKRRLAANVLVVVLCGFSLARSPSAAALGDAGEDSRISVEFENVAIAEAVKTLAELTNHTIKVVGPMPDRQVTLILRQVTLKDSLERIFDRSSFVIEWGVDDRITVRAMGAMPGEPKDPAGGTDPAEDGADTSVRYAVDQTDAIPPGSPDEIPVTVEDLERDRSLLAQPDMSNMDAFPPAEFDEMVVTVEDLATLASDQTARPEDFEAFPPGDDEEHLGITERELEAMSSSISTVELLDIEAFPPGEPGEESLTLRELKEMIAASPPTEPPAGSYDELFPGD